MITSENDSTAERQFTLFPNLYPELRVKVIHFALYQPRIVEISYVDPTLVLSTAIPASFHVNREMRQEASKAFGLQNKNKADGSLELEPQLLINYAVDTVLISQDVILGDVIGQKDREKFVSVAFHQSLWCYVKESPFIPFPHFINWDMEFPRLSRNLVEVLVLAVPEKHKLPTHPPGSRKEIMSARYARVFQRRVWVRDTRETEEVRDLWARMSIRLGIEYSPKFEQGSRDWTVNKEDMERRWNKVCDRPHYRDCELWKDVKFLRGVVDEKNIRGGKMLFPREG
jgi:hypothetical protein